MSLSIKQTRVVEVPVTELRAAIDMACVATILDAEGVVVGQSSTPAWMPQVLQIDLESGRIVNWRAPTGDQLQAMADGQSKPVEIDTFKPIETMPETVAALEKYMPQMTNLVDVSHPVTTTPEITPEDQHSKTIEIEGIKTPDHGWVAGLVVSVSEKGGKWSATTGHHTATSAQGKFEAINGVLNKAGMGRCEINQQKDENGHPIEGMYLADDARTKGLTPIYVSGHEIGKGHTARTSSGKKYTAPTEAEALDGLLREVLKVEVPDDAIVDTTDDEMVFNDKQRFIINMTKAVELPEQLAALQPTTPIEYDHCAIDAGRGPAKPRYHNQETGETWTGRGKQPMWLQAAIAEGAALADFLIPAAVLKKPLETAPDEDTPASYSELIAAIEYAPTLIQAAALINRINAHQDYEQRNALHAALQKRIDVIKAA